MTRLTNEDSNTPLRQEQKQSDS